MKTPLKLGILGSTRGSNLVPLSLALQKRELSANISIVLSNLENAGILTRATENKWPAFYISSQGLAREKYDAKITEQLQAYDVDLVLLIGYMRILSNEFINTWRHRVMNVHPSLLPAFAGKMDKAVHESVLQAGLTETGCTVHEVDEILDGGRILVQKRCAVYPGDTVESLKARVQVLEVEAFVEAIENYLA